MTWQFPHKDFGYPELRSKPGDRNSQLSAAGPLIYGEPTAGHLEHAGKCESPDEIKTRSGRLLPLFGWKVVTATFAAHTGWHCRKLRINSQVPSRLRKLTFSTPSPSNSPFPNSP